MGSRRHGGSYQYLEEVGSQDGAQDQTAVKTRQVDG